MQAILLRSNWDERVTLLEKIVKIITTARASKRCTLQDYFKIGRRSNSLAAFSFEFAIGLRRRGFGCAVGAQNAGHGRTPAGPPSSFWKGVSLGVFFCEAGAM